MFEVERGTSLDGYVWDRGHAMHCGKVALEKRSDESDIWNSRFDVQFPLCYA